MSGWGLPLVEVLGGRPNYRLVLLLLVSMALDSGLRVWMRELLVDDLVLVLVVLPTRQVEAGIISRHADFHLGCRFDYVYISGVGKYFFHLLRPALLLLFILHYNRN